MRARGLELWRAQRPNHEFNLLGTHESQVRCQLKLMVDHEAQVTERLN
jgi:hypothetical protein